VSAPKDDVAADLVRLVRREIAAHPYRTVAIAAGIGYLLGTRLGGPLLSLVSSRFGPQLSSSLIATLERSKPNP
jgi:hypothetical protein